MIASSSSPFVYFSRLENNESKNGGLGAVLQPESGFQYPPAEASQEEVTNNSELFYATLKKVTVTISYSGQTSVLLVRSSHFMLPSTSSRLIQS